MFLITKQIIHILLKFYNVKLSIKFLFHVVKNKFEYTIYNFFLFNFYEYINELNNL